jgi:hypothetical protein
MSRRPSPALVVAFLALLVSASGVTFAAIPAKDGDIHACYSKKTGAIELINTQRDRFTCDKNWKGLTIDTTPSQLVTPAGQPQVVATNTASRLVSPNGQFKIEATNNGASLIGPKGRIEVGASKVSVLGDVPVEVSGNTTVNLTGGAEINLTGGRKIGVLSGEDLNLSASRNATIEATDQVQVRARRAIFEGFNETRILARDLGLIASGTVDMNASASMDLRGSPVRINGTAQDGN